MSFRSSASFGKRQEFVAIAELLRRGFDVYLTLVDDQQIDCVVRQEFNGKPEYLDIQIKARSKNCKLPYAGRFSALEVRKARRNFYFIFYSERANAYWVMSSRDVVREATVGKSGAKKGRHSIVFTNVSKNAECGVRPRPRFEKYRDAFDALKTFRRSAS